ncbi:MAG TPA: hypothetical protein VF103_10210 [Polyangiaceae bacterium]
MLACGSKGSDEGDNGGGSSGSSGSSGSGGSSGSNTGGSATGGASGSATGGASGTATGGSGGSMSMLQHGFDTDEEGWIVEYTSSGTGVDVIDKSTVVLSWTGDDGDPDPGMLRGEIPYASASQYVGFGVNYPAPVDLSSSVLTAHVRVESGLGDADDLMTNPGGAKLYAKSGTAYCYAAGTYNNVTAIGTWLTIRFDMTRPPDYVDPNCAVAFDPSDVLEIGIQFDTGGTSMSAQPAVVNIDTISY